MKRNTTHVHSIIRPLLYLAILNAFRCHSDAAPASKDNNKAIDTSMDKRKSIPSKDATSKNTVVKNKQSVNPNKATILSLAEKIKTISTDTKLNFFQKISEFFLKIEDFTNECGPKAGEVPTTCGKEIKSIVQAIDQTEIQLKGADSKIKIKKAAAANASNTRASVADQHRPVKNMINQITQLQQVSDKLEPYLEQLSTIWAAVLKADSDTNTDNLQPTDQSSKLDEFNGLISDNETDITRIEKEILEHLTNLDKACLSTTSNTLAPAYSHLATACTSLITEVKCLKQLPASISAAIKWIKQYKNPYDTPSDGDISNSQKAVKDVVDKPDALTDAANQANKAVSNARMQITQAANTAYSIEIQAQQEEAAVSKVQKEATQAKKKLTEELFKKIVENLPVVPTVFNLLGEKKDLPQDTVQNVEASCNHIAEMLQKGQMQSMEEKTAALFTTTEKELIRVANTKE